MCTNYTYKPSVEEVEELNALRYTLRFYLKLRGINNLSFSYNRQDKEGNLLSGLHLTEDDIIIDYRYLPIEDRSWMTLSLEEAEDINDFAEAEIHKMEQGPISSFDYEDEDMVDETERAPFRGKNIDCEYADYPLSFFQ